MSQHRTDVVSRLRLQDIKHLPRAERRYVPTLDRVFSYAAAQVYLKSFVQIFHGDEGLGVNPTGCCAGASQGHSVHTSNPFGEFSSAAYSLLQQAAYCGLIVCCGSPSRYLRLRRHLLACRKEYMDLSDRAGSVRAQLFPIHSGKESDNHRLPDRPLVDYTRPSYDGRGQALPLDERNRSGSISGFMEAERSYSGASDSSTSSGLLDTDLMNSSVFDTALLETNIDLDAPQPTTPSERWRRSLKLVSAFGLLPPFYHLPQ